MARDGTRAAATGDAKQGPRGLSLRQELRLFIVVVMPLTVLGGFLFHDLAGDWDWASGTPIGLFRDGVGGWAAGAAIGLLCGIGIWGLGLLREGIMAAMNFVVGWVLGEADPDPVPVPKAPEREAEVIFLDNSDRNTVAAFMRRETEGAQRICICVGYVSGFGLGQLADWLDLMAADGVARLLIGMAPGHWSYMARTSKAHADYIQHSMKYGTQASGLDVSVLARLNTHWQSGRLQVRLRHPQDQIHAKLYLLRTQLDAWRGIAGSSNLSQSGLAERGEFNLVLAPDTSQDAVDWFKRNWYTDKSAPADDAWLELLNRANQ